MPRPLLLLLIMLLLLSNAAEASPDQSQEIHKLSEQLKRLEPEQPKDMADPLFDQPPFPTKMKAPLDIIRSGGKLPYTTLIDKPEWQRPVYKAYWHSSVSAGRWSYVPLRLHFAMHRLFTAPTAALSNYYDFVHDVGLDEELAKVQTQPQNADRDRFLGQYIVIAMQAKIEQVLTSGNQVIVVARPQRSGFQAFTVNRMDMKLDDPNEAVLFQLVTQKGDEIDYSF